MHLVLAYLIAPMWLHYNDTHVCEKPTITLGAAAPQQDPAKGLPNDIPRPYYRGLPQDSVPEQ